MLLRHAWSQNTDENAQEERELDGVLEGGYAETTLKRLARNALQRLACLQNFVPVVLVHYLLIYHHTYSQGP
jgi:hypothetical protein